MAKSNTAAANRSRAGLSTSDSCVRSVSFRAGIQSRERCQIGADNVPVVCRKSETDALIVVVSIASQQTAADKGTICDGLRVKALKRESATI